MNRVLIVEDNHDLAFGLRNNLEIEGYQVDVVVQVKSVYTIQLVLHCAPASASVVVHFLPFAEIPLAGLRVLFAEPAIR